MSPRRPFALLVACASLACAPATPPPSRSPAPAEPSRDVSAPAGARAPLAGALEAATAGVTDRTLATLLRDHWRWTLTTEPLFATELGVHAFDDRLPDPSIAARDAARAQRREFLTRAKALDPLTLEPADRVTLELFVRELQDAVDREVCRFDEWTLSPRDNPVTRWNELPRQHPMTSARDAESYLARVRQIPAAIDARVERLALGARDGLFPNAESTRRVLTMVGRQLDQPLDAWPLLAPIKRAPEFARREAWSSELRATLDGPVRQALVRYQTFLTEQILPKARPPDRTGLAALPLGPACYAALVRGYTTLPLTPAEVHQTGLDEIAKIDRELAALGRGALGTRSLRATLRKLRRDPKLYFRTSDEVEAAAREALAAATAAMPRFFGRLPKAPCVVRPIPEHEAPFTTIAYYNPPHPDGSKPGEYFINTYAPATRPRYEARVLAVHESIPGHHLQIAIAQELPQVPAFRRYGGNTVFVEGWALYTERMAEEMGLYRDDLDRLGMLSFDAWRAGRLVVDTGIHHMGWSREQAKRFLLEHTALAPGNIDNEVDRYIVWPGQALAYKIGQLEFWRLRREAERDLGDAFELPSFHDAVLGGGAVTLPVLQRRVAAYVESRRIAFDGKARAP